jgi:uncharacterized protein
MRGFIATILALLTIPLLTYAYTSPGRPQGFVNDFAHVMGETEIQNIESKLTALKQSTGIEMAVVTVSSLGDETVETYAVKLFEEWGIGERGKDTGLLLLVAPIDRAVRIEVGYGMEGAVTDIQSGNIIREVMIPAFKENKFGEGISEGVDALIAVIQKSPEGKKYSETPTESPSSRSNFNFAPIFFFGIFALNIFAHFLGKSKSWWMGGLIGGVLGVVIGLIFGFFFVGIAATIILIILGLIFDFIVSRRPPGSGGPHSFPMFFGGGRSGGSSFGGFGGGMSGGGGASGKW